MHEAVPASAFSCGVAWEPGAAGLASALGLRRAQLLGDAPGRSGGLLAFHGAGGPRSLL